MRIENSFLASLHSFTTYAPDFCPDKIFFFEQQRLFKAEKYMFSCDKDEKRLSSNQNSFLTLQAFVCLFTFICFSSYFFGCSSSLACILVGEEGL